MGNNYSRLSDSQLYSCFSHSSWENLNESDRQALLNEVVSRENVRYGAQYNVNIEFADMPSNISGFQSGNNIYLNREMFVNDRSVEEFDGREIAFNIQDSNWQALETVLHENRHVFQDNAAAGNVECDEGLKSAFAANGFTVSDVDGKRASQYLQGENNYSLYFLNPTELDAFKTSQVRTKAIISSVSENGVKDTSVDTYLAGLKQNGFSEIMDAIKAEFNNENVDKEVEQVLKNTFYNTDVPVDKNIESAVKQEMINSQAILDKENDINAQSRIQNSSDLQNSAGVFSIPADSPQSETAVPEPEAEVITVPDDCGVVNDNGPEAGESSDVDCDIDL